MRSVILLFAITVMGLTHAQVFPKPPVNIKEKNCHIEIQTIYKTGEIKIHTRHFKYKKKSQCEKMKKILSDNFSPSEVSKVETKMNWSGK